MNVVNRRKLIDYNWAEDVLSIECEPGRYAHHILSQTANIDYRTATMITSLLRVPKDLVHSTKRYYRELDKPGRHIPLPEPMLHLLTLVTLTSILFSSR